MTAPNAPMSRDPVPRLPESHDPTEHQKPTRVPASLNTAPNTAPNLGIDRGSFATQVSKTALCALLVLAGTLRAGDGDGATPKLSPLDKVRTRAVLEEKLVYISFDPGRDPASTHKLDAVLNNTKVRAELAKMPKLHARMDAAPESPAYKAGLDVFDNLFGAPSDIRSVQQVLLYPDGSVAWHESGDADSQDLLRAIARGSKAYQNGKTRRFRLMKLSARRLAKRATKDRQAQLALLTLYRNAPAQAFPLLFDQLNVSLRFKVLREVALLPLPRARHLLGTVADHKDLSIRAFVAGLLWALDLQN